MAEKRKSGFYYDYLRRRQQQQCLRRLWEDDPVFGAAVRTRHMWSR